MGISVPVTVTWAWNIFFFLLFFGKEKEMDEDSENRAIEDLHVVSSVCFHTGDETHK